MKLRVDLPALLIALRPVAIFVAAALAVLGVARLGLGLWQFERVTAANMLGTIFLQGLRFDVVLLSAMLLPVAVALPLFGTSERLLSIGKPLLLWYLVACFTGIVFMEVATPPFLAQFDARPNRLFVEYLIYPKEVGSTLLAGYLPQLIAAVIAVPTAAWLLQRALRRSLRPVRKIPWLTAFAAAPILGGLCVMGGRSTFDHRAVNPSTVAISTDPMVNDLALNSAYTVLYAVYQEHHELPGGFRYAAMPDDEVLRRVKAGMQIDAQAFRSSAIPTLHHQTSTAPRARPKNLVIVLEESLGAEFVGALGGKPLTPRLDALAHEGWWFENLYATGTRSVRGLEALVTGFTPTPAESVIKLGRSQRNFFSIAELLRDQGYDTSFIYGGEAQFDNMRRFFMNNGFDSVVDEDDYVNPVFRGSWGVADEDLFARASEEFEKPHDRPFFALVFSTSNHSPFEYPDGRIDPYDKDDPHTINNAVQYADYALGKFFDRARTQPYWQDTVFLVVADHNSRVYGAKLVPVEHFHIPGVILGGGIEPHVYAPVASQIDMPPTLLSLIGVSADHPMIGHDLTRPEFAAWPGRAIMQYGDTQAYMRGRTLAILRKDLPAQVFEYDGLTTLTPAPLDAELVADAVAHADWSSVTYEQAAYRLPGVQRGGALAAALAAPPAGGAPNGGGAPPAGTPTVRTAPPGSR
ncbi:MAG TPA: LTA synthase family protein [Gammaproteobacteria bacterium]|nr:LTA synthase family protein [Gammaproteobacteria bacterium]